MRTYFDLRIDVGNVAFFVDDKSNSFGEFSIVNAVSFGDRSVGIAQQWIIQIQLFGKLGVQFYGVTAGAKKGNVQSLKFFSAFTKRLAFFGSSSGECLGIPGYNHVLFVFELRKLVRFSISSF